MKEQTHLKTEDNNDSNSRRTCSKNMRCRQRLGLRSISSPIFLSLCYLCSIFYGVHPSYISRANAEVIGIIGPAIDEVSCFADLRAADSNDSEEINEGEFVTFLDLQSDKSFSKVSRITEFSALPPEFINLYTDLACDCIDCKQECNQGFDIRGAKTDITSDSEHLFAVKVCMETLEKLQNFVPETFPPTPNPTPVISAKPTSLSSTVPSSSPTVLSSVNPTASPTIEPTPNPTNTPTVNPTPNPTSIPTAPPTQNPTLPPTSTPTMAPSFRPSIDLFTGNLAIEFSFLIAHAEALSADDVESGVGSTLKNDMIEAISILTQRIVFENYSRRRDRLRRKLSVEYLGDISPTIDNVIEIDCSNIQNLGNLLTDQTTCMEMIATTTIYIEKEKDEQIKDEFTRFLIDALNQKELEVVAKAQDTNILHIDQRFFTPARSERLGAGEIAGIGAAGFVVGFALIGGMFIQSRLRQTNKEYGEFEGSDSEFYPEGSEGDYQKSQERDSVAPVSDEGSASGSENSYNESSVGSSGWSSGGVSSLNTSSVDSFDNDKVYSHGATLASIGLASGITSNLYGQNERRGYSRRTQSSHTGTSASDGDTLSTNSDNLNSGNIGVEGTVPKMPQVSRNDLDAAIQAGDWAAVGATAALLANAASDTNSLSTRSYNSRKSSTSSRTNSNSVISSVDAARAAELDHLVDTGDWEGVVLAASKFEAVSDKGSLDEANKSISSEDIHSYTTSSIDKSSISGSTESFGIGSRSPASFRRGGASASAASRSLASDTFSRNQRTDEIRGEVEALVRRVVPDEIDNVDEMMLQFRGREEELLETLRTMHERSITQKHREATNKNAKREAKNRRLASRMQNKAIPGVKFPSRVPPQQSGTGISTMPATASGQKTPASLLIPSDVSSTSSRSSYNSDSRGLGAILASQKGPTPIIRRKKADETSEGSSKGSKASRSSRSSRSSQGSLSSGGLASRNQLALNKAIDSGDWEAVGEAAAMMSDPAMISDTDTSSVSFGILERFQGEGSSVSSSAGTTTDASSHDLNAHRTSELDELIDSGNWHGVVAAASKYASGQASISSSGKPGDSESESSISKLRKIKPRLFGKKGKKKKEVKKDDAQDDSAQADLWMAIAAQSKQEGTAKGASDAADWAISRSLSALLQAETSLSSEGKVDKDGDEDGDESV